MEWLRNRKEYKNRLKEVQARFIRLQEEIRRDQPIPWGPIRDSEGRVAASDEALRKADESARVAGRHAHKSEKKVAKDIRKYHNSDTRNLLQKTDYNLRRRVRHFFHRFPF